MNQGLKENKVLRRMLAMVVQMGNYLNHGTAKGNSKGFKIGLIAELSQIKSIKQSKDKSDKISVLDFLILNYLEQDQNIDILGFCHNIQMLCEQAARIDLQLLEKGANQLKSDVEYLSK